MTKTAQRSVFLRASWKHLLMANFEVPAEVVAPYVPKFCEVDFFEGKTYISLVGFMFLNTRVLGIGFPWHRDFEEVNLRFYVRRQSPDGEWRRGVVFVKEIVPKWAIAKIANWWYRENYVSLPMDHLLSSEKNSLQVGYIWQNKAEGYGMYAQAVNTPQPLVAGSVEEFITEHYWGYARYDATTTVEYQVEHPRWETYPVQSYQLKGDWAAMYGDAFGAYLQGTPSSVLLANGSEILVRKPLIIK